MPLKLGNSKGIVSENIREFHTGKTYAHTAAKFGKKKANAQAIAVALNTARKYGKKYAEGGNVPLPRPDPRDNAFTTAIAQSSPVNFLTKIAPRGIPWDQYRRSQNIEDERTPESIQMNQQALEALDISDAVRPDAFADGGPTDDDPGESWAPPPEPFEANYPEPAPDVAAAIRANLAKNSVQNKPPKQVQQEVSNYQPTAREKIEHFIAGSEQNPWRQELASKIAGAAAFAVPGISSEESARSGDYQGAALGVMPGAAKGAGKIASKIAATADAKATGSTADEIEKLLSEYHAAKAAPVAEAATDFDAHLDVSGFKKLPGDKEGTMPGGWREDPATGDQWYVKEAPSVEQANNEKLTAELYKLTGTPVADVRLTTVNGKPGLASKRIQGEQLSNTAIPYNEINGLHSNYAVDAWLNNRDAVGVGHENPLGNIIVDKNGQAHRIDTGGGLDRKGTGGLKEFPHSAAEIDTMKDPDYNQLMAHVFGDIHPDDLIDGAAKVAAVDPMEISKLVDMYGPKSQAGKADLLSKLLSRQKDIAEMAGMRPKEPTGSMAKPTQNQFEQIPATEEHYNNAGEWPHDPEYNAGADHEWQPGPEWEPDPTAGFYDQKAATKTPITIPKPMSINKTHTPEQVILGLKNTDFSHPGISGKQYENIWNILNNKFTPNKIADAILDSQLNSEQIANIYSWLKPENEKLVDGALAKAMGGNDASDIFESALQKGFHANDDLSKIAKDRIALAKQLNEHASLPVKSESQRESDRLAGNFTTRAYKGVQLSEGLEDASGGQGVFSSNKMDVAHAYATWKNKSYDPAYWDKNKPEALNEFMHSAIQPMWLDTTHYIKVDAGGADFHVGNWMAHEAAEKAKMSGKKVTGAIIENVHDMPHEPYQHPSGEPFTVFQSWDPATKRSDFARFDKHNFGKAGMNLGLAGGVVGLGLAGSQGNGVIINKQGQADHMNRGGTPKKKAGGGAAMDNWVMHQAARNLHSEGMIQSPVPGRTDKLPLNVPAGSYVLPADFISALGQNNSQAGGQIAAKMFSSSPLGMKPMRGGKGGGSRLPAAQSLRGRGFADGGSSNGNVSIIAAGGEFVISPDVVRDIGHGSMTAGHKVLDALVLKVRKEHIRTLKSLKPPKK